MKSIIVPVDFSEQSEYALKIAASLAKEHKAEILVLHMLELSTAMISSAEGVQVDQAVFFMKLAEKQFETFLDKPYLKDVEVTPIIKHYKVFNEVNEIAEKHNADMIIMGSHGTDGLKEIFIGSNTEKMVRHSNIPVLVIKEDMPNFKIKNIVFASNFDQENLMAYEKASAFANALSAKLELVYINVPGDNFLSTADAYKKITKFLDWAGLGQAVEIYNDYTVEKGILNYSDMVNADLIAIPTHGRKGLSHFFMGSIGEDIANHSKIPVVTFKI
ncbi:nucleotide-binding universal stress UspA family protein [Saonia flava]|uniref:Nucleotide-binding universal stress UspA family protein n=1 Tax=Saonia flava TaxID=523696 RepID=A0A846R3D2_9FLAO|nr:universal stress protein [Saonia flava]NJB71329.1 nucleotide-binding universal stress UspA family protein [Saonia flava]